MENITDSDTYLRRKFRQDVTDKTTGIDTQAIRKRLAQIVAAGKASGFPVVTGAGKIELPETLTLSFPDGLRSSCANLVLASGTSVVAPSSFAGWTLDAPSTPATGIRCQVNGGVVSVRVLGLGGTKIIFR